MSPDATPTGTFTEGHRTALPDPRRVARTGPGPDGLWPLHDSATTRQIEQQALQRCAPHALMAIAGASVARLAQALAPHAPRVSIFCGPGNNGGDGLVAARLLQAAGQSVRVQWLGDEARLPADAADALRAARGAGVVIHTGVQAGWQALPGELAIDALLGLGASRPPAGEVAQTIEQLRHWRGPVLAVDLPSGLDADTGQPLGSDAQHCVRADHTLSLLTLKPGLFTGSGRDLAGCVWLDTLGVTDSLPATAQLVTAAAAMALRPPRQHVHHKGSFGDVLVLGGAAGMQGAALLAAQAALQAGAGRVYLHLLDATAGAAIIGAQAELMQRDEAAVRAMDLSAMTVVCGCGGGDAIRAVLPLALAQAARLVLDADALNAIAGDSALATQLRARSARGLATVLTPHPLEAARLLGTEARSVQADRLAAARRLAQDTSAVVVLKGSGTVIATAEAPPRINASGNAALATAGSGDVLAGWTAGLWSQRMAPLDAATLAVLQHGLAADAWVASGAPGPLNASRLIRSLACPPAQLTGEAATRSGESTRPA